MNNLFRNYGLYRDPAQGWIAGVAAGLADRFGVDDSVIRLVFVLLAVVGTPFLALAGYAVLAVVLPVRPLIVDTRSERAWRHR